MENNTTPVTNNKTATGLEPNIAGLLCYVLGWITGLIFYFVEKDNKFVRFHAMQSIITFGALNILQILIGIFSAILVAIFTAMRAYTLAYTFATIMGILVTILWLVILALAIFLIIKAYQNETYKLPIAGKIAEKQLK